MDYSNSTKTLVIIRGLSGSGKTTLADLIVGAEDSDSRIAIAADDFFYDDADVYNFNAELLKDAHDWCKQETESCMLQNFSVIVVHNTFTRRWEVEPYIEIAAKHNYRVSVVNLYDGGLNDMQLAQRSVHGIPISSVRAQRSRWENNIFATERQPTRYLQNHHPRQKLQRRPYSRSRNSTYSN